MRLHFVWMGKTRDRNCAALIKDYLARIGRYAAVDVSELKEQASGSDEIRMKSAEGSKILSTTDRDDFVILLDEHGETISSTGLAKLIDRHQQDGVKRMAFIIGGFAGVSEEVRKKADIQLSLSRMTLTHEMARLVLVEQVYRAYTLLAGLPYHRS